MDLKWRWRKEGDNCEAGEEEGGVVGGGVREEDGGGGEEEGGMRGVRVEAACMCAARRCLAETSDSARARRREASSSPAAAAIGDRSSGIISGCGRRRVLWEHHPAVTTPTAPTAPPSPTATPCSSWPGLCRALLLPHVTPTPARLPGPLPLPPPHQRRCQPVNPGGHLPFVRHGQDKRARRKKCGQRRRGERRRVKAKLSKSGKFLKCHSI